ncbi:MAG: hypothetical protein HQ582_22055 [Planctomycetes bacterium]|nr:hypothetical protein [Planctomycetota bacterium]
MPRVLGIVGVVGILAVSGVALAIAVAIGTWILRPLDRAAKNLQQPTQFTLIDFFCLFFLIQFPTGIIHAWAPVSEAELKWLLTVYGWASCVAMWWFSVQKLSRAGIHNPRHRSIFLAFVLPVAFFGSIGFPLLLPVISIIVLGRTVRSPAEVVAWAVVVQVALVFGLYGCGRFTRRMVAATVRQSVEKPVG